MIAIVNYDNLPPLIIPPLIKKKNLWGDCFLLLSI